MAIFTLQFGDYTFPNQTFELEGNPDQNNMKEDLIVQAHGSVIQTPFLRSKKLRIRGFIHNNVESTSQQELLDMQAGLLVSEKAFRYRSDREINSRVRKIDPKYIKGTDKAVIETVIDLITVSPFYQGVGASNSDVQAITGTTLSFDVVNSGNAFSEPKIFIYADGGTIDNNFSIENTNNNQTSIFQGIIANGTTLELNSKNLDVFNNSVAALTQFEGNFITLLAGTNSLQVIAPDCQVTVEHKYRWFS